MGEKMCKFSVVIPCYNEAASLPELISISRFVAESGGGEIILVDNGSTDNTFAVLSALLSAQSVGVRYVRVPVNVGYGHGILAGLAVAKANILGWTHADLQTDPTDVLKALTEFENSSAVFVKGKRFSRPLADRFFTAGMSFFETVLLRKRVFDINAQPTLFDRDLFESWQTPPQDFSLDLYAYYQAKQAGYQIRRFPVIFASRKFGQSSWNVDLRSKWKFIKRTISYSLNLRKSL